MRKSLLLASAIALLAINGSVVRVFAQIDSETPVTVLWYSYATGFVDVSGEAASPGGEPFQTISSTTETSLLYVGSTSRFRALTLDVARQSELGECQDIDLFVEVFTGGAWDDVLGLSDGTMAAMKCDGECYAVTMQADGVIAWLPFEAWTETEVNGVGPLWWVRLRCSPGLGKASSAYQLLVEAE